MRSQEASFRQIAKNYGKSDFTTREQVSILLQILHNELDNHTHSKEIESFIKNALTQIKKEHENLYHAKRSIMLLMASLETSTEGEHVISRLKSVGLKKFVFHQSQLKGEELPQNDILKVLLRNGFIGVGVSSLFIALFVATSFVAMPAWLTVVASGLFTGSAVYLSGLLYGVINDIFATKMNLPYFLLGHQPQQRSLLKTNDPYAQGIAWGVAATFGPVVVAAIAFAVVGAVTAAFAPLATFTLPLMMVMMPLIAVGAEFYAKKRVEEIPNELNVDAIFYYTNDYQSEGIHNMCPTSKEKASWFANSDRNVFGFTKVPFIGLGALGLLVGLSVFSGILPAALVTSTLLTTIVPAVFAATGVLALTVSGIYMYFNKDTQIDNRYKLNWEGTAGDDYKLHIEESDLEQANSLLVQYQQGVSQSNQKSSSCDVVPIQSRGPFFQAPQTNTEAELLPTEQCSIK